MDLALNFEEKLLWIHNFLPQETYKNMYVEFIKSRNKLNFTKSSVAWNTFKEEVDNMSESYSQQSQEESLQEYLKTYHNVLKNQSFINFLDFKFKSHLRIFKHNQHLAWHSDEKDNRKYAASFYFNRTWNDNWGGELMFKSKEASGFIPVLGNSLVIVKKGLIHKVNANLKKTHPRLSIQTWISFSLSIPSN